VGTRCADHMTPPYPQKLALTSPTGGGRSVGIVRVRTKATEFSFRRCIRYVHNTIHHWLHRYKHKPIQTRWPRRDKKFVSTLLETTPPTGNLKVYTLTHSTSHGIHAWRVNSHCPNLWPSKIMESYNYCRNTKVYHIILFALYIHNVSFYIYYT